jgi:hypothetical protein
MLCFAVLLLEVEVCSLCMCVETCVCVWLCVLQPAAAQRMMVLLYLPLRYRAPVARTQCFEKHAAL